ncbi:MAG: cytochrome P450 [Acidimicrobiia bacterium]
MGATGGEQDGDHAGDQAGDQAGRSDHAPRVPFDPYAPSSDERYAAMAAVRAAGGVVDTTQGWYVGTAAGVETGLRNVDRFVGSFMDTASLPEEDIVLAAIPEPRHGVIRRVVNTVVAGHRTAAAEPFIRAEAARLVDLAVADAARGEVVDLVDRLADPLPSAVIAHMTGAPVSDHDKFRVWSDELLEAQNRGDTAPMRDFHPEFADYIQTMIDERRATSHPPDDLITRFLRTDVDGEYLSDRAIVTQTMFILVAGNETTRNLIANCLHTAATQTELYARLRADRRDIAPFVEESLRLDSPVQVLGRAVLADTEIEGAPLATGDRVVFGIASANRDEAVHDHPAEFDIGRPRPREHLAFGTGPHVCPGATLARLEATAILESFVGRVASVRLVDGFVPAPNPVFWANGHRRLPALVTPADHGG